MNTIYLHDHTKKIIFTRVRYFFKKQKLLAKLIRNLLQSSKKHKIKNKFKCKYYLNTKRNN